MKRFSIFVALLCIFSLFALTSCEKEDQVSIDQSFSIIEDYSEEIQSRSPLYEVKGQGGGTAQSVCRLIIDAIKFSNGDVVNFGAVVISNNVIDSVAAQNLVESIQQELFLRYDRCFEVKLHLEITQQLPSGFTYRWIFCIGDISGSGSVVDEVTRTAITGDCANSSFLETNTYTFDELSDCAPFDHQFVAGCRFERINHVFLAGGGSPGLHWTDAVIRTITTSDGTVYTVNIPLLAGGVEVLNADAILAQIFQQAVFNSYGLCFDSRAEFLVQELAFAIYLGLGDISPATTYLSSYVLYFKGSNGVEYTFSYNIDEHPQPGQFVVLDQTCP